MKCNCCCNFDICGVYLSDETLQTLRCPVVKFQFLLTTSAALCMVGNYPGDHQSAAYPSGLL